MRDDCLQVDELLLQLADYKNDYAEVAAEKLLRTCSISWEAYSYLKERVHEETAVHTAFFRAQNATSNGPMANYARRAEYRARRAAESQI